MYDKYNLLYEKPRPRGFLNLPQPKFSPNHGNSFLSFGAVGAVGGWVELDRTALGSGSNTISVASLADKRYYMLLTSTIGLAAGNNGAMRVGNGSYDSGNNYARRLSKDGGTDATSVSFNRMRINDNGGNSDYFAVQYVANLSANEKLFQNWTVEENTAGAANVPIRSEGVSKWANTSNVINQIQAIATTGNYGTGSELVVLGWDPADTHTDNFWEELASVELGGTADQISSGTITAKKYLWVQLMLLHSGLIDNDVTFNNDTAGNYAERVSLNGGADITLTSQTRIQLGSDTANSFHNLFIINNSAEEKLVIHHKVDESTAGAATAPERSEGVSKWDNTSAQITEIDCDNAAAGDYLAGTIMKVWGAN